MIVRKNSTNGVNVNIKTFDFRDFIDTDLVKISISGFLMMFED